MANEKVIAQPGAEPEEPVLQHRVLARYPCHGRPMVRLLERPSFKCLMAMVHNFSGRGLGLIFHRPLDPGAVLALQFRRRFHGLSRIVSVRVIHATPQPDGNYLIGCELNSYLSDEELELLRHPEEL
jgi:hypothetical protein